MAKNLFLSKSKYLHGLQCPKYFWYEYHDKSAIPPPKLAIQRSFDEGKKIGELAQKLFPGGLLLAREREPRLQHKQSVAALKLRRPLFEPGFVFQQTYALADILTPVGDDEWDMIEVKSSTSVKSEYYHDAAFQRYVYEGAGLKIRRCFILHLNKGYIRRGALDVEALFNKVDITQECQVLAGQISAQIELLNKVMASQDIPAIRIGPHCDKPHHCPLSNLCWSFLPEEDNVFLLNGGGQKCWELLDQGITKLTDIPANYDLNFRQVAQIQAHQSRRPYFDKEAIREFLTAIKYPLFFLDFETLATAVPLFDGVGPYQPVPFQYVVYCLKSAESSPEKFSFLAPDRQDPRETILRQLQQLLGEAGSIIAYSAAFEKNCLKAAANEYPEYREWVERLNKRFVDLLVPFQKFYYYHPQQLGRASIKNVLPALTGRSYKGLEIGEGGTASAEFYRVMFGDNVSAEEREKIRAALEIYCDQDTLGMVEILEILQRHVK
ncbi:DUF2779 domain-containing protein [Candidatus Saganbacteria bacterium]|nr:DUF2779 domain-containing protein [Candidatus Saganbacteria bacterium]